MPVPCTTPSTNTIMNIKSINKSISTNRKSVKSTKNAISKESASLTKSTSVEAFLTTLHPEGVFEIRVPCTWDEYGKPRGTSSGYYDNSTRAARAVALEGTVKPEGIYVTLNPVKQELLARSDNENKLFAKYTTTDSDIERRRWLLIDIDPVRPSGISSTEREMTLAIEKSKEIRRYLSALGWPRPIRMMSGNGSYLLYRIDLPVDDDSRELVKAFLGWLAEEFDDAKVKLDRSVFNASRIIKVAGTYARKGDPIVHKVGMESRPHRMAYFFPPRKPCGIVTEMQLKALTCGMEPCNGPSRKRHDNPAESSLPRNRANVGTGRAILDCRTRIAAMPGAIEGQSGSKATFRVACVIARHGLSIEQGMELLEEYNDRCQPRWTTKELRHKLRDAFKRVEAESSVAVNYLPPSPTRAIVELRIGEEHNAVSDICRELGRTGRTFVGPSVELVEIDESGWLSPIKVDALRTRIAECVDLRKTNAKGQLSSSKCDVALSRQVFADDRWPEVPRIRAVSAGPTILTNGRVLQEPGLDGESGVYVMRIPDAWKVIPEDVDKHQALDSMKALKDVVSEYKFTKGDLGATGWIALVLTGVARAAIDGPTPMFVSEARAPGAGKTMLIDLASLIATGDPAPFRTRQNSIETHKEIVAALVSGRQWIAYDNERQGSMFTCATLASLLTSRTFEGRKLGASDICRGPNRFLVTSSGNHLTFSTEIARRTLLIELEYQPGRKWNTPDLRAYVRSNRSELLRHALIILKYGLTHSPENLQPLPSFEEWSAIVRESLVRLGQPDPVSLVEAAKQRDAQAGYNEEFVRALILLIRHTKDKTGEPFVSATKMAESATKIVVSPSRNMGAYNEELFLAASMVRDRCISDKGANTISPQTLGRRMQEVTDSVTVDGCVITRGGRNNYYTIKNVK